MQVEIKGRKTDFTITADAANVKHTDNAIIVTQNGITQVFSKRNWNLHESNA